MDIGEAAVDTVMADSEALVVNTQEMQHGGMDVVNLRGIFSVQGLVTPLVTFAGSDTTLDAAATEPVGEDVWIVITTLTTLGAGHASELSSPVDDGVI